jgi:tetratricopeptide (TPR) repeat protein
MCVWLGVSLLCFSALTIPLCSARQAVGEKLAREDQSPEQLTRTAETYEKFLREGNAGTSPSRSDVRERLGAVYFLLHRYRDSLDALAPVLNDRPTIRSSQHNPATVSLQAQSWLVSGLDYLQLNQLADARRSLRRALSMQPDSPNARMALGDALARSGQMEDAAREYEKQAKLTPSLADSWYKLGLAHSQISAEAPRLQVRATEQDLMQQLTAEELLAKGDNLNAARTLFRLARRSPNRPDVHAELGAALLMLGYVTAARDHFRRELVENPESPLAELGLAQTAAIEGDWTAVVAKLEHLSVSQPRELVRLLELPPAGLVAQAWTQGQMNPPASFIGSPAGALWKSWLSDSNVLARVSGNEREGSVQACSAGPGEEMRPGIWLTEECYSRLIRRLKGRANLSSGAMVKLAEGEFRLGRYEDALHSAQILRAVEPQSGWAVYWLSKSHDAIAEQCFLKVGALNPDSARVHQMLAEHYAKLSDYPKAKTEFQNAIRRTPDSPDLHLGLGTVLSRAGDWVQAEKELKTTLELAPKSAFAHYQLGHVYVQQSLWPQAIEQLRQVPADSTALLSARLDLAKAESEVGQTDDAVRHLLSVASLDQDGEVYFRLATLYRSLGDQARARDALGTFKQRRAASLETDTEEVGALEKEQETGAGDPQSR